jgi:type VI secretion system protein VasG
MYAIGVGKTELAKAISTIQFNRHMIRINMNDYQTEASMSNLIGASAQHVGSDQPGELVVEYTKVVKAGDLTSATHRPCVILLDEFDKACDQVQKFFLTMFDESYFKARAGGHSSEQRIFPIHNCIVMITSNLFSQNIVSWYQSGLSCTEMASRFIALNRVNPRIAEEVIGRCNVIPFIPLTPPECEQVAGIQLNSMMEKIKREFQCVAVVISDGDKEAILQFICHRSEVDGTQMRLIVKFLEAKVWDVMAAYGMVNMLEKDIELSYDPSDNAMVVKIYHFDVGMDERSELFAEFKPS